MSARRGKISRRDFLKGTVMTAGALGIASAGLNRLARAATPGVAGNRVVWVHDDLAHNWGGSGYYGDSIDQTRIDAMIRHGIMELTGQPDAATGWRQIIQSYLPGKIIAMKVNINNGSSGNAIDAIAGTINGIVAGLISIGVMQSDIWIMEPSIWFSSRIANPIFVKYPNVLLWDGRGTYGHQVTYSIDPVADTTIRHSNPLMTADGGYSYLPDQVRDATYLINLPIMKGHGGASFSLTFKNNFGFLRYGTIAKLHDFSLPPRQYYTYDMNPLHDIYLNSNIKNKTVLIVGDGLFCTRLETAAVPQVWTSFGNKYPKSVYLSTDPVAIDSVMFDFLNAEATRPVVNQQYLHRAADLGLGIHEHWNNVTDKMYSSIDFRKLDLTSGTPVTKVPMPPSNLRVP